MYPDPTPPGPPGADAQPTIPTQTAENAEAGTHTGTGLPADVQGRWWRARLACGLDVTVTHVHCPTCEHCQAVDILPLTALSDVENVGWVPVDPDEDEQ